MYNILKLIAEAKNWSFEYGRRDYSNLYDEMDNNQIHIFLDPVQIANNFDDFNTLESKTYSGSFMLVVSSDLDEDYTTKYNDHIKPLLDETNGELLETLGCHPDITIEQWNIIECVNVMDYGFDGLLINYQISEDVQ